MKKISKLYKKHKKVKRRSVSTSGGATTSHSRKKRDKILEVDVLGTPYLVKIPVDTRALDDIGADGLCDDIGKQILLRDLREVDARTKDNLSPKNAVLEMKHNIRHELIHAFVHECGLAQNDSAEVSWAVNEACVDFYALQYDKLAEVFRQGYQILTLQ